MQGESISPTLFSAFINDIVEAMNKITSMGVVINNIKITVHKNNCPFGNITRRIAIWIRHIKNLL